MLETVELLCGSATASAGVAQREPLAGPAGELLVGCPLLRMGLFCGSPLLQALSDITLKHFGEIMVAVELVFIGDANKGLDGFHDRHGCAPFLSAEALA